MDERQPARAAGGAPRPRKPSGRTGRRRRERRILAVGIGVSVGLHILFVALLRWPLVDGGAPNPPPASRDEPGQARGMTVVELAIADDVLETPEDRPEEPTFEIPVRPPVVDPGNPLEAIPDAPAALPHALERLQPRIGDPRLWAKPNKLRPEPPVSDEDRLRARIYGRLNAMNDSLLALSEAERRSKDWSYETEDGKRWGISSEGIHLGSITLPAPSFAPPPGRREEIDRLVRNWHELSRQAEMAGIREDFDAQVRAIRERRDAERRATSASRDRDP